MDNHSHHKKQGYLESNEETFKMSGFVSRGLIHMTAPLTSKLAELTVSSADHMHHYSNPTQPDVVIAPSTTKHHRHKHNHHRPHHHASDETAIPPLSAEEQQEFDSVGQHVTHLREMHPHLRRLVYSKMHHITVKEGHLVIKQGEVSDAWYILLRGSLQCIATPPAAGTSNPTAVPVKYQFDRHAAEQKNIEKEAKSDRRLAKKLSETKDMKHKDQIGEEVHYYFGHGKHITGLVVGVFHPGDSFGETCFHFAEQHVTHHLREENKEYLTVRENNEGTGGVASSNGNADRAAVHKTQHQLDSFTRHPHDHSDEMPPSQPPKEAKRSASVVALEDVELLTGTRCFCVFVFWNGGGNVQFAYFVLFVLFGGFVVAQFLCLIF